MLNKIIATSKVIAFSWKYSLKVGGKRIWLLFLYTAYISIHPIINAYFLKLAIDNLSLIGKINNEIILHNLAWIFIAHFIIDSWDNFVYRHSLVLSRTLQRKLLSGIEIDLAYKNASLPIITIENASFKDKYSLVKREVSFRLYPLVDQSVTLLAGIVTIFFTAGIIINANLWYFIILTLLQLPRILILKSAITKITSRAVSNAKLTRLWEVYQSFLESIKGSYEARILEIKDHVKNKLVLLQRETVGVYEKTENELLVPRVLTAIIPMSGVFAISFFSAKKVVNGLLSIGDWQLIVNTAYRVSDQLKSIIDDVGTLSESCVFVEQLIDVLNEPEEKNNGKRIVVKEIETLEFENVSFKYPNINNYALKNVSFTISKAQNVAVVGHNGAGKTTLVKLICGFYMPIEGQIKVNGININDFNIFQYRKLLSTLFQDFESYGTTARESIGYGNIEKINNTKKLIDAAKISGIDEYIQSLPLKYQTPLIRDLENGVGLSTGQWQKIAIARALFRESKIIILDEPTSNLDPESEEEIFNRLIGSVEDRIMFLISHRFSTVKRANRILVMDEGQLIEDGSHQELMNKNGTYARLFQLQSKSYKE